jgi:alpha-beta hydrolase superfamily lysophospholipase
MPREYFITSTDGVSLFTRTWMPEPPEQSRATVVLVHGIGEHSGRYAHVGEFLRDRAFSLLGFDLRGHGLSHGARGDTPSYSQLLADIALQVRQARMLIPGKPVFLFGHSLGGNLGLNYILRRMSVSPGQDPVDGAIISGPALRLAIPPPSWKIALARVLIRCAPGWALASGLDATAISRDPAVVRAYRADPLVHDRVTSRLFLGFYNAGEWALQHAGDWPTWPNPRLPVLLSFGTADRLVSTSAVRQFANRTKSPAVELQPWEGLYHEAHNEPEQRQVLNAYARWLDSQAGPILAKA